MNESLPISGTARVKGIRTDAFSSVERNKCRMPLEASKAGLLNDDFTSSLNELAKPVSRDMPPDDADVMGGKYRRGGEVARRFGHVDGTSGDVRSLLVKKLQDGKMGAWA